MIWSAWAALRQRLKGLQTRCCGFKYQAHRREASASARCKATSARIPPNCSTAERPRSAHYGAPSWPGSISIPGDKSRAPTSWQARSNMQFISPNKSLRPEYHLRLLDLGGGFPWPFGTSDTPVDISALREKLQRVNAQRRLTADANLWFESGRYLVASSGTLLSTVLDVKVCE